MSGTTAIARVYAVVDASVCVKWFLPEADTPAARELLVPGRSFHAPDLLVSEFCNALRKKSLREGLRVADAGEAIEEFLGSALVRFHPSAAVATAAHALAVELEHPVYDCLYIALAVALDTRVITADRRLAAAVRGTRWSGSVELLGERNTA